MSGNARKERLSQGGRIIGMLRKGRRQKGQFQGRGGENQGLKEIER